ncbi:MAG TPA: DUF2530 domain-containing protein [Pseudonocardiaceae bacterium]|nr:DUF2530 domain-containing protein [Pseudonocardiaceae bacterium]
MTAEPMLTPPPLPARWVDMRPLLAVGTGLWFLAYIGLLVARYGYQADTGIWLTTCLAGWVLGVTGAAVMYWQRSASRRGSRGAQRMN